MKLSHLLLIGIALVVAGCGSGGDTEPVRPSTPSTAPSGEPPRPASTTPVVDGGSGQVSGQDGAGYRGGIQKN